MSPKGCHSGLLEGININRLFAMLKKYLLVMNKAYITMRVAASPDVDFEPIEPVCSLDAVFIAWHASLPHSQLYMVAGLESYCAARAFQFPD